MTRGYRVLFGRLGGAALACIALASGLGRAAPARQDDSIEHAEARFEFIAAGPLERVAPLFGAAKEQVWSSDWTPRFIHPRAAGDRLGMVFTVPFDGATSVWINTAFDLKNGFFQYAYFVPDTLVTLISVRLTARAANTRVEVEYARTALGAHANALVKRLSEKDKHAGPEWDRELNGYLKAHGAK